MRFFPTLLIFALATTTASAYDPGSLQDFCVGVNSTKFAVFTNGKFCKDPNLVMAEDFIFTGLRTAGSTNNQLQSNVTPAFVDQFLGLNTLGISTGRIDFAPGGLNPPHVHPRASEVLHVVTGILYAGFVGSNEVGHRLFTKILYPGDLMVFPVGLIHFQFNIAKTEALAFPSFNSQNPGIITVASSVFGAQPKISVDVLAKAFQMDKKLVEYLQSKTWEDN